MSVASPTKTCVAQAVSAALVAGAATAPLHAQEIDEIMVTATKRAESVMDVPIAITAIQGDYIRDVNLDDVKDLVAFTPGITGNSKDSFLDGISVRGIRTIDFGNGGDPSVSIYKNGLYQGRNGSAVVSLYDVERAEILRGPQGFLFGRNSVSGAMNVITVKPSAEQTAGYLELDAGERGHFVFEGAVNMPVSDTFALRLSGYHSEEDGYVGNLAGGDDLIAHDKTAGRVAGRYETDKLTVDFFAEHEKRDQTGTIYRATGRGDSHNVVQTRINGGVPITVSPDGRVVNNENSIGSIDNGKISQLGLQVDYDLGFANLTSLTGFKDHEYHYIEDFDGSPLVLFNYGQDQDGDYFEQEFRLTSNSDGPLSWYAGASLYQENIDTVFLGQQDEDAYCQAYWFDTCQGLFDYYNYLGYPYNYYLYYYFGTYAWTPSSEGGLINDRNRIIGKYSGYSAYVNVGYEFSDSFDISLGMRYSYDEKEFSQESLPDPGNSILAYRVQTGFITPAGALTDKKDWNKTTWRLVANWRPNDATLLYASAATGYKPGGFGSFNIEPNFSGSEYGRYIALPGIDRPADFGPETVTSYEIGYKGTLADGRVQIAANIFNYEYEDMQAVFGVGPIVIVDNIGKIDGDGFEMDVNASLSENIDAQLGFSWFDSKAVNVQAFCGEGEEITGDINVCEGNSIPWAPEFTAFAVLKGNWPTANGDFFANLAWTWEDEHRAEWPNLDVIDLRVDGINQTDLLVGYKTDNWRLSAYVENLTDELWYDGASVNGSPSSPFSEYNYGPGRPRTFGIRFGYEF